MQSHIHETKQGSKKSSRVFQILLRGGGGRGKKFRWGVFFYWVVGIWGRVNFTIWTFSRVKTTFCKYWTSIKIKITMTWVCKENEDKIKMVEEEWLQFLLDVFILCRFYWIITWKLLFGGERLTFAARGANKHLVRGSLLGWIFPYGRMSTFLGSRRNSPHLPVGKTLRIGLEVGEGNSEKR